MPWSIEKRNNEYCVIKGGSGEVEGCHASREAAAEQVRALYASEKDEASLQDVLNTMNDFLQAIKPKEAVSAEPQVEASAEASSPEVSEGVKEHPWEGVLTLEETETGDGRLFRKNAVTWKDELLPFPFTWQRSSAPGHDGNVTIGRVDSIFRGESGEIRGRGVILTGPKTPPESVEYLNLLKAGAAGWVSIDGDDAEFEILESADGDPYKMKQYFNSINIRSLCAVSISAFETAKIQLTEPIVTASADEFSREDRSRWFDYEALLPEIENGLVASGIVVDPPAEWFAEPKFSELTPVTITDDGRVFGHLCGKETCHIGFGTCRTSPRNCDYDDYFHLGQLKTAEGETVFVGHMTFGGGHAPINQGAQSAAAYYDSTSRVAADIRCGEDEFGTWVVGALRPSLSAEDVREIRSAPLSGDWRPIKSKLQLIAAHGVNVPGFPIPRAKVLVASGVTETIIITEDCGCVEDEFASLLFQMDLEEVE